MERKSFFEKQQKITSYWQLASFPLFFQKPKKKKLEKTSTKTGKGKQKKKVVS
jgi:hypothetical protein